MLTKIAESETVLSAAKSLPRENAQAIERQRMEAWLAERVTAGQKEPVTEVVALTPVLAALLLERNDGASDDRNRRIREVNLARIKHDIESGNWAFTGQSIVVAKNGKLNDGQHRCRAVVETGRTIVTVIVFGPERGTRMRLDMGAPRSVADFLSMQGYHDTHALGAVAGMLWTWDRHGRMPSGGSVRATKADSLQVILDQENSNANSLVESLVFVARTKVNAICSRSILAFVHHAIWKKAGKHVADEFLDGIIEGVDLEKNSPVLYCRNRLVEMRSRSGAGSGEVAISNKVELLLRGYNIWRRKERVSRSIPLSGRLPELEA